MTASEWVRKAPSTAQRRLAGAAASAAASAATNEAAPLTRAAQYNTLLIKTTHDSTPVCLDVVRMTLKRNTWRMDLCQITVYDALRVGQYVDQSSSRAWKSLVRIFSLAPKLSGLRRCILNQILNFHDLGPRPSFGVRYQALVNL